MSKLMPEEPAKDSEYPWCQHCGGVIYTSLARWKKVPYHAVCQIRRAARLTLAAAHWHGLYRAECLKRQNDAARYGQRILDLETAAPEQPDHTPPTWEPLSAAPMYVYGRDALVGQWVDKWGWKKVTVWEPQWTRDDIISRGGTHWWPHLRDLSAPTADALESAVVQETGREQSRAVSVAQASADTVLASTADIAQDGISIDYIDEHGQQWTRAERYRALKREVADAPQSAATQVDPRDKLPGDEAGLGKSSVPASAADTGQGETPRMFAAARAARGVEEGCKLEVELAAAEKERNRLRVMVDVLRLEPASTADIAQGGTPRTDAAIKYYGAGGPAAIQPCFVRFRERELAEAQAKLASLRDLPEMPAWPECFVETFGGSSHAGGIRDLRAHDGPDIQKFYKKEAYDALRQAYLALRERIRKATK